MHKQQFIYDAIVKSVYDGDTIRIDIDMGFSIWRLNEPIRLYGIDAPEIRGEERPQGIIVRDWLRARLPVGSQIIIETIKDRKGKYGRYLARIYVDEHDIGQEMIHLGLAVPYMLD